MKCVKNPMTGVVKRVGEKEAQSLVAYGWTYVTKTEWKQYNAQTNASFAKAQLNHLKRRA